MGDDQDAGEQGEELGIQSRRVVENLAGSAVELAIHGAIELVAVPRLFIPLRCDK